MKKKIVIFLIVLSLIVGIILIGSKTLNKGAFSLDDEYYGTKEVLEINDNKLEELIDKKKNFVVFIYQPLCTISGDFSKVLDDFLEEEHLGIYKLSYSNVENKELKKKVKYYPSVVIYKNGKIVAYLEANKNDDVKYYESKDGFREWLKKYVILKNR